MLNYQRVIYLGWWFHDDSISPPFVGNTTPDIRSLSTPWAVVLDHLAEGGVLGASWRTWSGQKIQKEQPWSWGWFWYRYFHGCREKQWVKALEMVFFVREHVQSSGFWNSTFNWTDGLGCPVMLHGLHDTSFMIQPDQHLLMIWWPQLRACRIFRYTPCIHSNALLVAFSIP